MGLKLARWILRGLVLTCISGTLFGAPKLRLDSAALGPFSIPAGQNGGVVSASSWNAGDGNLNLAVTASVNWLAPALGTAGPCAQGTCTPINITLQTAGLAKGIYTGTVLVADPNALDAPQTITVTVQMGGGVPDRVDFFVAPNGSRDEIKFKTSSRLTTSVTTNNGGNWLSVGIDGVGTFDFVWPYKMTARHIGGLPEGAYTGSVNVTNSSFAPDIKNVPVSLRVTSQPIAQPSAEEVLLRAAEGMAQRTAIVDFSNRGLGTLDVTGVQAATVNGGDWLSASLLTVTNFGRVTITANTAALPVGQYEGTVTVQSNAVNGPHVVRVVLRVVPQTTPTIAFGGVVNNATFAGGEALAKGGIAAIFGEQFNLGDPRVVPQGDWVQQLGDLRVLVNGNPAPMHSSGWGQINFLMPYETPAGEAIVQVERNGQPGNRVTVQVADRAPRMLPIGNYAIVSNPDGTYAAPARFGGAFRAARIGETVVIWAVGLGPVTPPVTSGKAAPGDPLSVVPGLEVVFNSGFGAGVRAKPFFAGLSPTWVGLYQINVTIPGNAPRGDEVPVTLDINGVTSNRLLIAIE